MRDRTRATIIHYVQGLLMGSADVVPGISGGTVALIVGIYERLVSSIRAAASTPVALVRGDLDGVRHRLREVHWGLVIPLGLPLLILVMSGMTAADEELPGLDGMTAFEAYVVPLVMIMVVAVIGVVNMPSFLAGYRKYRVLRRLAVTPANPLMVLGAQVGSSGIHTGVGIGIALTAGWGAFDLQAPHRLAATVGVVVLAAAAMYALGMGGWGGIGAPTPRGGVIKKQTPPKRRRE
jgi:uncharacterized membrane protein